MGDRHTLGRGEEVAGEREGAGRAGHCGLGSAEK